MRALAFAILLLPACFMAGMQPCAAQPARARPTAKADPPVSPLPPTLAPMLAKVSPSVVNISVRGMMKVNNPLLQNPLFRQFFNVPQGQNLQHFQAVGSGVIYNARDGYIITNNHVIRHATQIMVTLHDHRQVKAKLVAADPQTDIAVLKIKADLLHALPLGNSDNLRVGDYVVAIGDPFGVGQTATFGIVSALGRTNLGIEGYENFIQTDASINPGNSGGALVDMKGHLIGMNTAILSRSGGNVGIGFAIPINMVKDIANQLIAHGKVSRGELGVLIQDLTPGLAQAMDIHTTSGALVSQVLPRSAAAAAGLKSGDVITAMDDRPIRDSAQLRNRVGGMQPGTVVHLAVLHDGHTHTVAATLKPMTKRSTKGPGAASRTTGQAPLGLHLTPIPPNAPQAGKERGVYVAGVKANSAAAEAGIRPGDIITRIGGRRVDDPTQAAALLRKGKKKGRPVLLRIRRDGSSLFVALG